MATVNGITAEKAQDILDDTIASAAIEGSTLVFTKTDGSSFEAGNFDDYIDDSVDSAVTAAVAGGLTPLGNVSGTIPFTGITAATLVNRLFTATLIGNITVNSSNLPSGAFPGTQFAMVLKQDATGSRLLTLTGIKRSQGVLYLTSAANAVDIVVFMFDGTSWYAGPMGIDFK